MCCASQVIETNPPSISQKRKKEASEKTITDLQKTLIIVRTVKG
jgi:hypothetical protein